MSRELRCYDCGFIHRDGEGCSAGINLAHVTPTPPEAAEGEVYRSPFPPPHADPQKTDDIAAPAPYRYGKRRRNPYYRALHDIRRCSDGEQFEVMISADADVTDVIHAFGLDYDLGEVVAKICRLWRKEGTDILQEFIKMHEHIQAAEDAWVAEREGREG